MQSEELDNARLSDHAVIEMSRKSITESEVSEVLARPGKCETVWPGRLVLTSLQEVGSRRYVLRVFVDVDQSPVILDFDEAGEIVGFEIL